MAISVEEVKALPERDYSQRKRRSKSQAIADQALASRSGVIRITSADAKELDRTHKSLVQWTTRHNSYGLKVRKDADCVFVYRSPVQNPGTPPSNTKPNQMIVGPEFVRRLRGRPPKVRELDPPPTVEAELVRTVEPDIRPLAERV